MNFVYEAVTPTGRTLRGVEDAASEMAVERLLRDRGLFPIVVAAGGHTEQNAPRMGRRQATVEAVRYLGTLVDAGFPLDKALDTVSRLVGNLEVAEALVGVREAVRAGSALADAMARHPRAFPPLAVGMTRAGERGGHLPEALRHLAAHLEREEKLRDDVASALIYPAVMALVGGTAIAVLLLFVLPKFVVLLEDAGAALPASTQLLMSVGDFLGRRWMHLLLALAGMAVAGVAYRRSEAGRLATDRLVVRLPVVGPIRQNLSAARLGRSLASLLGSGLPVVQSLDIAASTLSDAGAEEDVRRARQEVETGVGLAVALRRGSAFPHLFHQMIEVGEEGGRLQEMLERSAQTAEESLERALARMVRLVEPTLIVTFGIVAGFVALSLVQAIYGMRVS